MIKLLKLCIYNFMGIVEYSFEIYDNGLYMVVGPNGCGKSTRLEALAWCIYGKTVRDNLTNADILNEEVGRNCLVDLHFEYSGSDWLVRRTLKHKEFKNSLFVFKDNVDLTRKTIKETQELLGEIFGDFDIFISTVFFPQQFSNTFLDMTDKEQKDLFEKILNFDQIRENAKKCKEKVKQHDSDKETAQKEIEENKIIRELTDSKYTALIHQYEENVDEHKQIKAECTKWLKSSQSFSDIEKLLKKETELHSMKSTEKNKLENDLSNVSKENDLEIKNLNSKALNIKRMVETRKRKYETECELFSSNIKRELQTKFYTEMDILNKKIENVKNSIRENDQLISSEEEKKRQEINKLEEDLRQQKHEIGVKCCDAPIYISVNNGQIKDLEYKITKYEELKSKEGSPCPVCFRILDDNAKDCINPLIEEIKIKIKKLQDGIDDCNKLIKKCKEEEEKVDAEFEEKLKAVEPKYRKIFDNIQKEIKKLEAKNKSTISDKDKLEEKINNEERKLIDDKKLEIENKKQSFEIRVQLARELYKKRLTRIESKFKMMREGIQKSLGDIEIGIKVIDKNINEYTILKNDHIKTTDRFNNSNENIKKLNTQILKIKDELIGEINKIDECTATLQKQVESINKDTKYISFWLEAFSNQGIENLIIGKSIPFLNSRMHYYLTKMNCEFIIKLQNTDFTQKGEERNKLSCKIYREGNKKKETKFIKLSGGEKRIIDIAMMFSLYDLAISRSNIISNVIFFDEVFDSLDDENGTFAVKLMKDLSETKSCYLITHNTFWKTQDYDEIIEVG